MEQKFWCFWTWVLDVGFLDFQVWEFGLVLVKNRSKSSLVARSSNLSVLSLFVNLWVDSLSEKSLVTFWAKKLGLTLSWWMIFEVGELINKDICYENSFSISLSFLT